MEVFRLFTASTSISENRKKKKRKSLSIRGHFLSEKQLSSKENMHACISVCAFAIHQWLGMDWTGLQKVEE